jgi:hypothetical protein
MTRRAAEMVLIFALTGAVILGLLADARHMLRGNYLRPNGAVATSTTHHERTER